MLSVNVDPRQLEMDELRQKLVGAYDAPAGYNPDVAGQITQRMRELMTQLRANESAIDLEAMKAMYLQGLGSKAISRKLFVSREFVLEHIKRWRLQDGLRPHTEAAAIAAVTMENRRFVVERREKRPRVYKLSPAVGKITADMVAAAVVTVCRRVPNVTPEEIIQGRVTKKRTEWWWSCARFMTYEALSRAVPDYPKMRLAKLVGVSASTAVVYGSDIPAKKRAQGYSASIVFEAFEAVKRVMPS